jgi:Fe-Mn family superoxide dismutase
MMRHRLAPIACKPWALDGLSEQLIVSHYENHYGSAVRCLNAIQEELAALDLAAAPAYQIRAMKRLELETMGSVALHELYFGTLGGDGATLSASSATNTTVVPQLSTALEQHFGSVAAWHREFVMLARSLTEGSGWVLLSYSRSAKRLHNHIAFDYTNVMLDAAPLLALDMHEHAYHIDFGANASSYIDALMRNIDWNVVNDRLRAACGPGSLASAEDRKIAPLPSVSVEELAVTRTTTEQIQLLDTRPKHYFSRSVDMMQGATWRDPERIDEWSQELSADVPVIVYCAYGYSVGCDVTAALRERGFDAKYVQGGLSAWYAAGGDRALRTSLSAAIGLSTSSHPRTSGEP